MNEIATLLTSKELAEALAISWQVVGRWKREGKIPAAIDEPGCLRFDLAEVRAVLAARANNQPEANAK